MITEATFTEQVKRLKEVWPNSFTSGRAREIWFIIRECDDVWLINQVNYLIINNSTAPTPSDFYSLKRSYLNKQDSKKLLAQYEMKSVLNDEERSECFSMMKKAALGLITKDEAKQYAKLIEGILKERGVKTESMEPS